MALSQFLTNIANAIRSKKGTTESIPAANFATEVNSLKVGGDISEYFTDILICNGTNNSTICESIKKLPEKMILASTSCRYAFADFTLLTETPEVDTSNSIYFGHMFYKCPELITVPRCDAGKCVELGDNFFGYFTSKLENFGGLKDLGKAYTQKQNNYRYYALDLNYQKKLTHESLMNVINNLYDLNLTYDVANGGTLYTQQLAIGNINKTKLTAAEIAIATSKGWSVV